MSKIKLSKDEKNLLDSVESGEYTSVLTEVRKKELAATATNSFRKDKRINIRISNRDLIIRHWFQVLSTNIYRVRCVISLSTRNGKATHKLAPVFVAMGPNRR